MNESLGHRIRKARKAAGLSQEDVAKLGGPARPTLSRLERGAGQAPERFTIESLVKVLRVRPEWLIFGTGNMHEEGAREDLAAYQADTIGTLDTQLLGQCFSAVVEALDQQSKQRPTAPRIGAVMAEVYDLCRREGKQPNPELVAPFIRILLA